MSAALATWIAFATFTPVRRPTSAQNEAPSAPFSCTIVNPSSSTARATSSSVGFTNTPTTSHLRRKAAAISVATARSPSLGLPWIWINPTAQAPSRTASAASSRFVIPQNLTRTLPGYGKTGPTSGAGPAIWALFVVLGLSPEGDVGGLLVTVAEDLQFERVARLGVLDIFNQLFHALHLFAVGFGDDV